MPPATNRIDEPLKPAEIDALRLMAEGLSMDAAAEKLFITAYTVKSRLRTAYRKLGARNMASAVHRAHLAGYLGEREIRAEDLARAAVEHGLVVYLQPREAR